ncbi:MAG: flavin-nucleotide-binding protein [Pseudonocardiales bacterium]|nr:flavin-nucleotide-binding protein [Jatrophihabitantaceae bacterium]MCW2605004.1 flavin-nucleotide-binding protein [Pseudonocardiales bacterium]
MHWDSAESMDVLTNSQCLALLRTVPVGRIGIPVADGAPEIIPINFVVDRGTVVFRTGPGTKFAAALEHRPVTFEADGYTTADNEAWSVVIKGTSAPITGQEQLLETYRLPLFPWQPSPKNNFVRIEPDEITGRRFHPVDPSWWNPMFLGLRTADPASPVHESLNRGLL